MPALLMTAAEIAAAEAAAAQILAAQQAAAATAAAAAEAVQVANAAQAAQVAQAAQTGQAAQTLSAAQAGGYGGVNSVGTATNSGMQALANEVGATVATATGEPTGIQRIVDAGNYPGSVGNPLSTLTPSSIPASQSAPLVQGATVAPAASSTPTTLTLDGHEFVSPLYTADQALAAAAAAPPPAPTPATPAAPVSTAPAAPTPASTIPPRPDNALYQFQGPTTPEGLQTGARLDSSLRPSGDPFYNINSGHIDQTFGRPGFGVRDVAVEPSAYSSNLPAQPATGLQGLLDKGLAYAEKNPLQVGLGVMSLYNMLNKPKPYEKPKYKSTFNAGTYRGYEPTPPTPYTPQYAQYAKGGWAGFAPAVMKELKKTGLFKDKSSFDPSKYVASNVEPPTPYTPQYAQGGISDLGAYSDYARGGRMLKGPGDGMSDDIPATIANKQPARLANEEFVIPADVVSHLGNGSSEAGAKALYKMMDRVRQARTGNKKQGKQINPEKFLA